MSSIIDLALCFQYTNPANGDLVVKASSDDYVKLIGQKTCNIVTQLGTQQNILAQLSGRIAVIEAKPAPNLTLPSLYPKGIASPTELMGLLDFTKLLEQSFLDLQSATGNPQDLYDAIAVTPASINTAKALGTSGGTLGALPGWALNPTNLADSFGNLWLAINDMRSGIRNMMLTCCSTSCDGISIVLQTQLVTKTLKLFFTGTIPSGLVSCVTGGSMFKIQDNSGNSINQQIDVGAALNIASGITFDLTGTPLNFADDLKITGILSLCDSETGTQCQRYIEEIINNIGACPQVILSTTATSISYQFTHVSGTLTYSIQLFTSSGVMVQSRNLNVSTPIAISGSFDGLTPNTDYKVRLQTITENNTKTCPFTPITTSPNPCPEPNSIEVTLTLD